MKASFFVFDPFLTFDTGLSLDNIGWLLSLSFMVGWLLSYYIILSTKQQIESPLYLTQREYA